MKRFPSKEAALGIGDDAVLLNGLLMSQDLLIEGVHFSLDYFSPEALAHKALHVNLSDIAAMGGIPKYIMLGLSIPFYVRAKNHFCNSFLNALCDLCDQFGIQIIGGDTTKSLHDVFISITIFGLAGPRLLTRSGAKPGDKICVTGFLGESNAGLQSIQKNCAGFEALKNKHTHPQARLQEGQWLAKQEGVTAMMDLSDGLFLDLPKLCEASNVGAKVHLENLPISESMKNFAGTMSCDLTRLALEGGEDYELLLTIDADHYEAIQCDYQKKFKTPLRCIGEITSANLMSSCGVCYFLNNTEIKPSVHPFTHEE